MSKVIFFSIPAHGHTNPTLPLVKELIAKGDYGAAEKSINEGITYSRIINDTRLEYDFTFTLFELENRKKNYQAALGYLKQIYTQDSLVYKNNESIKLTLRDKQYRQQAKQLENDRIILEQKYTKTLFWASSVVAALAIFAIFLGEGRLPGILAGIGGVLVIHSRGAIKVVVLNLLRDRFGVFRPFTGLTPVANFYGVTYVIVANLGVF